MAKRTEAAAIADEEFGNFTIELAKRVRQVIKEDTHYQSFQIEIIRFHDEYEFYIPGVTNCWETKYQMKSQRIENIIQQIIRLAKERQ